MTDTKRYDHHRRRAFFHLSEEDAERMRGMRPFAEEHLGDIVAGFYEHLLSTPETRAILGSDEQIARLRKTQSQYFMQMTEGTFDERYVEGRLRIGRAHERIGLGPEWYVGAYLRYMMLVMDRLIPEERMSKAHRDRLAELRSMMKVVFFDMSLAIDTYVDAMVQRQVELKDRFTSEVSGYSEQLGGSTNALVSVSSQLSATSSEQAATVSELATTVAELRSSSERTLETANEVIADADHASKASASGLDAVQSTVGAMHEIQEQVDAIAGRIGELGARMNEIGEIIDSVNEIAEQSKLLALNAAIEAARAGAEGRGFAVVATEIRTLAEQSKEATKRVRGLLSQIRQATQAAVTATELGSRKVRTGVELAGRAGDGITTLTDTIRASSESARRIADASKQQDDAVAQIADAMQGIKQGAAQTASALMDAEQAAQALANIATQMDALVASFGDDAAGGA